MSGIPDERLAQIGQRFAELEARLASGTLEGDAFVAASRDYAELEPVAKVAEQVRTMRGELAELERLDDPDPEMRALAHEEAERLKAELHEAEHRLAIALLPHDVADARPAMLEIRAGTGGDEAALFAADLFRMYTRYVERRGWRVEPISISEGTLGGIKEAVFKVAGDGAFGALRHESGVHRVQRVPATEAQGRIHTSACTVAIMPEADALADIQINPADLRIDTFRASGAGGQHINKTDSAVRITHLPTGLVVECQDDRSQHRNKDRAMQVLAARLKDRQEREAQAKEASARKSLIGSGDRSDRIRTYNFPQGRVTDHRINLTLYKIDAIMDGDLDELVGALAAEHQAEQLAALGEEA